MPTVRVSSDEELISALARGDEAAFTCLYERYRRAIFGFLLRILRNHADAEDVLQLVFVEVWRNGSAYDASRGRPVAWLFKRAQSRAIDHVRSRETHSKKISASATFSTELIGGTAEDAARPERRIIVRAALAALSEEQRQVLDLAYFEGLTQPEMAALLAIPLGTVKTRVRDGLIKLRRLQAQQPLLSHGKLPNGSSQKKVLPPLPRAHPPGDQALSALS